MKLKDYYTIFAAKLLDIYTKNEAAIITGWVFESLAGFSKLYIVKNGDQELEPSAIIKLNKALDGALKHQPVQYITGEAWFYNMKLKVNDQVLIPRPETEELVEAVGSCQGAVGRGHCEILDIGTGSGCIAIAIKKNIVAANVTAIDISAAALQLAKENAANQKVSIHFKELNFLDESVWEKMPAYDIIVSNPPYIPVNEKEKLDKNVIAWEPHSALFAPVGTPLLFYEKIASFAMSHLKPGGKIFMEIHENYGTKTAAIFKDRFSSVEIKKDISGKDRMVIVS
jgi:release factor glutamine methyltransferase